MGQNIERFKGLISVLRKSNSVPVEGWRVPGSSVVTGHSDSLRDVTCTETLSISAGIGISRMRVQLWNRFLPGNYLGIYL